MADGADGVTKIPLADCVVAYAPGLHGVATIDADIVAVDIIQRNLVVDDWPYLAVTNCGPANDPCQS